MRRSVQVALTLLVSPFAAPQTSSSAVWLAPIKFMESGQIVLSNLELLRLHIKSGLLLRQIICRWSLSSLTYLIMDSPLVEDDLNAVWETFGQQLGIPTIPNCAEDRASVSNVLPFRLTSTWRHPSFSAVTAIANPSIPLRSRFRAPEIGVKLLSPIGRTCIQTQRCTAVVMRQPFCSHTGMTRDSKLH